MKKNQFFLKTINTTKILQFLNSLEFIEILHSLKHIGYRNSNDFDILVCNLVSFHFNYSFATLSLYLDMYLEERINNGFSDQYYKIEFSYRPKVSDSENEKAWFSDNDMYSKFDFYKLSKNDKQILLKIKDYVDIAPL